MNSIKFEKKKKGNTLNIKFSFFYLIILIIIFQIFISEESKFKLAKLSLNAEIMIHIEGKGKQPILNLWGIEYNNEYIFFNYRPSKIYINNISQNITKDLKYDLTLVDNEIILIFNESLNDCNVMFFSLENITKINFLKFNSSNFVGMLGIFSGFTKLTSVNLSALDTSKVTSMTNLFLGCKNLRFLDTKNFNI